MEIKIKNKKVIVAMSGGVDSSVAAFLLKKRGYKMAGVFMKFWRDPTTNYKLQTTNYNTCCSEESEAAARAVADKLNMPFYVVDISQEFKKAVVDYFLAEYQIGRTPNPCVVCNREIKFGLMLKKMKELDGDYLASGHYVRKITPHPNLLPQGEKELKKRNNIITPSPFLLGRERVGVRDGVFQILKSKDIKKDQTYFLWTLTQEKLRHLLFPIGEYTKDEVRKIAEKNNLPYYKKESFDVCFINGEISDFLKRHLKLEAGDILLNNKAIGRHEGLPLYTIGQRQGIGLSGGPFYVAGFDLEKNRLIITNDIEDPMLFKKELIAERVNWIGGKEPHPRAKSFAFWRAGNPLLKKEREKLGRRNILMAKIRYGAKETIVDKIEKLSNYEHINPVKSLKEGIPHTAGLFNRVKVIFREPVWAATSGQSIVFYSGEELLGGGVII